MSDAQDLEAFLMLPPLEGGRPAHDERVRVDLSCLRRTEALADDFVLRELDESLCLRSRLDEPFRDVMLRPRGRIAGALILKYLSLSP